MILGWSLFAVQSFSLRNIPHFLGNTKTMKIKCLTRSCKQPHITYIYIQRVSEREWFSTQVNSVILSWMKEKKCTRENWSYCVCAFIFLWCLAWVSMHFPFPFMFYELFKTHPSSHFFVLQSSSWSSPPHHWCFYLFIFCHVFGILLLQNK